GLERFLSMEKQPRFPHPIRVPDAIIQASNRYVSGGRIGFSVAVLAAVLLMCSGFYAWWNKPPVNRASSRSSVSALPLISLPSAALSREANESAQADTEGISQVVLDLSATEKTWLSITSEGKQIFSGVLEPSQTKTLTGLDAAKVKVGNAGGLEVKWNGKEIGPIGARGQVRTILFTPDNFQILNPPPATSSDETL
ncbi:MAG TPA: DUF4115 domain-containing protein, partial [Bryobacteraceae bacterium]|nr:DUF4115 domain-containing protein [Bryobacteraceae bacterium]